MEYLSFIGLLVIPLGGWMWKIRHNDLRHLDERIDRIDKRIERLEDKLDRFIREHK